jgi:hypothetical protein
MEMIEIVVHVLLGMVGGALIAGIAAWLSWELLSWTHHPGWGPLLAFVILAVTLHGNDFTQMILIFSGLFALIGLITLSNPDHKPAKIRDDASPINRIDPTGA